MRTACKLTAFIVSCLMACMTADISAQTISIKGKVTDSGTSEPLVGVTVMIKGSSAGTSTAADGTYAISASSGDVLVFSIIGYKSAEAAVENDRAVINMALEEDAEMLEETVVVGYGTMDKKELTSAISHISSEDFLVTGGGDPAMLIQGKVAGVSITNTGVGNPNSTASIQIRGISSRKAGLEPLIVIDGIAGGDLANLNQNDIESIDILKDGAASAIYGTRGSNGVIQITTKKGSQDGSIHTSYSGIATANFMIRELDMLTADQWREYRSSQGKGTDYGGNTDWLKEVSRVGFSHQHTLSLSGGNSRSNYRVSADYRSATGIDRRSEREEYGARASVNHTTKSGLFTFSANIAPRVVKSVDADQNVFFYAIEANPTTPVHDPDDPSKYFNFFGQQASYNPVESIYSEKKDHDIRYLDWDATARLNIMEGLSTQVTFSDQHIQNYERMFRPSTYTESINKGWSGGEASQKYSEDSRYSLEWIANWQKNIKDHNIKVMLGYSYQYFQHSEFFAENKNFPNDGLTYNDLEAGSWAGEEGKTGVKSARYDSKLIAFFGRVNYDYKGKYLLTLSYRREGSSKFGANNKWGNFPAVSAGWRISQENFMRGIGWIDDLKIRADFGVTGNQNFDSYLSLSTMTGYEEYYYDGSWFTVWGASKNANPDLKWELGINWNVGLDFSLLDYRLTGSVNYYNRTQQDLLGDYNVPVPPYLFPTTYANVGTMRNSGVEIELNWDAVRTWNFSYSIGFAGATISNKMVSFSNPLYRGQDWYDEVETQSPFPFYYLQRLQVGERIGNFCMYEFAGFNKQGQWLIYDKNGELKAGLDANDEDKKIVGNGLPQFTASMTHTFRYKNWDLSLYFRGAFGFDIFNLHDFYYGTQAAVSNVLEKAYTTNSIIKENPLVCDYFLEKGDWVKLDMANLGYTLNLGKKYIERIRFYITGKNLLTFTGFSGVDPASYDVNGITPGATFTGANVTDDAVRKQTESASGKKVEFSKAMGSVSGYYPSCRQVIFGVQIDF